MSNAFTLSQSLFLALILFLAMSDARPSVAPFKNSMSYEQEHRLLLPASSHSVTSSAEKHPPVAPSAFPRKRMMPDKSPGQSSTYRTMMHQIQFTTITTMFPVRTAAQFLAQFFAGIAIRSREGGVWSGLPQKTELGIEEGNFRLSFRCVGDTIPWNFIKDMADLLWETAVLGVTDLFEAVYTNPQGTIGVSVMLSIIENSSGGGSNSPNGREGSVPSITS